MSSQGPVMRSFVTYSGFSCHMVTFHLLRYLLSHGHCYILRLLLLHGHLSHAQVTPVMWSLVTCSGGSCHMVTCYMFRWLLSCGHLSLVTCLGGLCHMDTTRFNVTDALVTGLLILTDRLNNRPVLTGLNHPLIF